MPDTLGRGGGAGYLNGGAGEAVCLKDQGQGGQVNADTLGWRMEHVQHEHVA